MHIGLICSVARPDEMRLYTILTDPKNENLKKALERDFPKHYFDFEDGQWFVAGEGTATEIYRQLSKDDNLDIGSVVVISISGYNGYATVDLWDWMQGMQDKNSERIPQ